MSGESSMFNNVVCNYVEKFCEGKSLSNSDVESLTNAIKHDILQDAAVAMSDEYKEKVKKEAADYKKRLLSEIKISIIIETIFIAFLVGIIVNQVTELIPQKYSFYTIIISLLVCVLLVVLAASESR